MRRRLAAILLVFVTVFGGVAATDLAVAPPAAAAPTGIIGGGVQALCEPTVAGLYGYVTGDDICKKTGNKVEAAVKKEWNDVWNSLLGDVLKSAEDVVKWVIKKVLTFALLGPSLNLRDTGLWGGRGPTLAGMLVWLGWVFAAAGFMWQLGKMAVTGQTKYAGQAMIGWVQNALLSGIGLTLVATLLTLGDEMTKGLVDTTFGNGGAAYDRIIAVLLPSAIENPMTVAGVVVILLLVGFVQMLMIFLRQAAIPIQCLLLPIAGAGRMGGEETRKWLPRLMTSILVAIAYKPLLAIIICTGFWQFGHAYSLTEWLRGVATLVLGVLAPGPLMRLFAPLGAEMGAGLAAGGALGMAANVSSLSDRFGKSGKGAGSGDDDGADPANPVNRAAQLNSTMPKSYDETGGQDAVGQAARNQAGGPASDLGAKTGAGTSTAATGLGAPAAMLPLQVLDGVNSAVQKGANEIGGGGE